MAYIAFQSLLSGSEHFIPQRPNRKDYGTDCQIEVLDQGRPTNVRFNVQMKGSERLFNADGSLSIAVRRTNLNYLIAQPYSVFVLSMCRPPRCGSHLLRACSAIKSMKV